MLRHSPHYRRDAFDAGLEAAGLMLARGIDNPRPNDVLLIWNRYGAHHALANRFEAAGAKVLCAENCPLGNSWRPGVWYSLALGNPAVVGGQFKTGGTGRWDAWRVPLKPWRTGGELVALGQRSIGNEYTASPFGWADRVAPRLKARVRPHPGTRTDVVPLDVDLSNAGGVLTWASSAALHALRLGVPVWYEHPGFIGASASLPLHTLKTSAPRCDDGARLDMFRRLAWCMWELEEISNGDAIRWALREREVATCAS
jgi:hypothetical protein